MVLDLVRLRVQGFVVRGLGSGLALGLRVRICVSFRSQKRHHDPHLARDIRVRVTLEQHLHDVPFLL